MKFDKLKKKYQFIRRSFSLKKAKIKNKKLHKKNLKKNIFAIDLISTQGLGANLVFGLQVIDYCDQNNLVPYLKFTLTNSTDCENPFDYFFKINNHPKLTQKIEFIEVPNFRELDFVTNWDQHIHLDLKTSYRLIDKYLTIDKEMLNYIDAFCEKQFGNKNILGIHYRGTDKKSEAKLISFNKLINTIKNHISNHTEVEAIFIATDDSRLIPELKKQNISIPIIYHEDKFKSDTDKSIHLQGRNLYDVNFDALVNCLLLSRCNTMMKTSSLLSAWSKLFNPNLQVIVLSKPFEYYNNFPESEIQKISLQETI